MNTKKLFALFLAAITAFSLLAGCGSSTGSTQEETADAAVTEEPAEETGEASDTTAAEESAESGEDAQPAADEAEGTSGTAEEETQNSGETDAAGSGNVLVVYYSATGNTEAAANAIADATGGDLFELEPVEPYTDEDLNYGDENSRVSQEHEDESLRNVELVSTTVENWDSYDTVFIGYPKMEYSL